MSRSAVLYVEDDENDVFFMRKAFRKIEETDRLHSVFDVRSAIAYLSGEGNFADRELHPLPAVVVIDINLPGRSGFDLLQWIRKQSQFEDTPVLILSSSGRPEDRARAMALGANEYLIKPTSGHHFTEVVRLVRERWLEEPT
jgi:DNA-binding response OmpR family regulator